MKRFLLMGITLGFLLSWAVESIADQPKRGGTLTMAIRKDIALMNPLVGTKSVEKAVRGLIFEPLLGLDLNGKIQPNLAERWSISKDGKLYTFKLRKGVKFHNGQEMKAEDIKFAIDYTLEPRNGAYGLSDLEQVKRVEAPDKYTLKIHLKKASPVFLSLLTSIRAFSAIPKESLEGGVKQLSVFPPGTGPFKFVEWKSKRRIVLVPNENYWGQKAYIDKLILRPIRNATVRFTALRAGDVDMVDTAPLEWVQQVVNGNIKGINYASAPREILRRLQFNVPAPPFNNKKLRQAVAHAINRKELMQSIFYEFGVPSDQKYPKGHVWYFQGISWPAYDLAKARTLLKEAGYKGETVKVMVQPAHEVMSITLQAQLRKIGMNVKLDMLTRGAFASRARKGAFEFRFTGGSFYPDPSASYGSDFRCPVDLRKRTGNNSGYCDKEMDDLIKKGETEFDPDIRRAVFKRIVTKVAEDLPEVYLGYGPRFFTFRNFVKGFSTDDNADYRWWRGGLHYTWLDK